MKLRRHSVVCQQAVALVTAYLEDSLPRRDRSRLERHLGDCPHCGEYFDQMRRTIAIAGRVEPDDLSDAARDDLVALYRSWLAD